MQKVSAELALPVVAFGDTKKSNELGPQYVKLDARDQRAFNLLYNNEGKE